jgi:hypothetical protein
MRQHLLTSRLGEKFTIHNQLDKADRLKKLTAMFFEKTLSNTYEGVHHSILRMLVELSKDNLTQSKLLDDSIVKRQSKVKIDNVNEIAKMKEMLKAMDDEIAQRKDTAEEDSIQDDESDIEEDNIDKGDLQQKTSKHFLSSNSMITERLDRINLKSKESPSHIYSTAHHNLNVFFGGFPFQSQSRFDLKRHNSQSVSRAGFLLPK